MWMAERVGLINPVESTMQFVALAVEAILVLQALLAFGRQRIIVLIVT